MTARRTLERHERTLGELRARLAEIPGPMWGWRPAPGAWSAAEVYDHIDRIARLYSFPQLEASLRGEGRRGGGRTLLGWCLLGAPWLAGVFRVRRDFPEAFVPAIFPQEEAAARLDGLLDLARGAAGTGGPGPGPDPVAAREPGLAHGGPMVRLRGDPHPPPPGGPARAAPDGLGTPGRGRRSLS
ncbi:MAG: DinB family protein [Holophagaceae bacterium]|nr:DinB family protein [Holophagaceae bacterium]